MNIYSIGLFVENRAEKGPIVQEVLTRYGQDILARLGIPDRDKRNGLIGLFLESEESAVVMLEEELERISGVSVNIMKMR